MRNEFGGLLAIGVLGLGCAGLLVSCGRSKRRAELPVSQKEQILPTGMAITPTAARGSIFGPLNPGLPGFPHFNADEAVTTAVSPDGNTLLILTSGYNQNNDSTGRRVKAASEEYVFVYDIASGAPRKLEALEAPNTFDGIAWNPDGREFYVSGGVDDDVHAFDQAAGRWGESGAPIALGHSQGLGIHMRPEAAGLAVNAAGTRLAVANFENDSVSVVDIAQRKKIAELDLRPGKIDRRKRGVPGGEFPLWVAIEGNQRAYVSSPRDREIDVVDIAAAPRLIARVPLPGQPNRMILNREQTLLFAALGTNDSVAVVDTRSDRVLEVVNTTAPSSIYSNPQGFKGSNPNSLALSPEESTLYVSNGGTNSVAVVHLAESDGELPIGAKSEVVGLIPTGWYPNSISISRDGSMIYVVNGRGQAGPNPRGCRTTVSIAPGSLDSCYAANQYILQLTQAGFLALPTPAAAELKELTAQVARNEHFEASPRHAEDENMMAFLRENIKHVIYIVKENRSYDQVLGDLDRGNGDPKLAILPEAISPNHHLLARQFADLDNFYCSGEVSGDGWNWSTAARASDLAEKTIAVNYADRGLSYDFEGENRNINVGFATLAERRKANPATPNDPDLLPGTADVLAPDGPGGQAGAGYLWDAALRAKLTIRNYGFFLDLRRYSLPPTDPEYLPPVQNPYAERLRVAYATKAALQKITDPYFRGFDQRFPDFWRFKEWEREFGAYEKNGKLPSLELVRLPHDHFGNFQEAIDGVNTVETEMADNDYSIGLLVEQVAHSPYRDNTLIFIVEDDAQNGPDHVDAHRSVAFILGPFVKQGAVVSTHYTTVNMLRTIEDVLGIGPMGLNDAVLEPMADVFTTERHPWTYSAIVPAVLRSTKLPLPPPARARSLPSSRQLSAYARPQHDAAYWAAKTRGFDFSVEDHLDSARFNRILWRGLAGPNVPYPTRRRSGRDLRQHRERLLREDHSPNR